MNRIVAAELRRFFKNKVFWGMIILTVSLCLTICFSNYSSTVQSSEYRFYVEDIFFIFYQIFALIPAGGISLILGSEYSDGTIRNKLAVGHRRVEIYFSYLIVCSVMNLFIMLIHFVITIAVGYPLYGGFNISLVTMAYLMVCCLLVMLVFSALSVLIVIACQSKSSAAVLSIGLVLGMIYAATLIGIRLEEFETAEQRLNVMHKVLAFLYDVLPTGQLTQMYYLQLDRAENWILLSGGLFAVLLTAGAYVFKKKDIR